MKSDRLLEKTFRKLDAISLELIELGVCNSEISIFLFYESLAVKKIIGGIKYDLISSYSKKIRQNTEIGYHILLENNTSICFIVVKYKVQKAHIDKLLTKKQDNFRILYPEFANCKLYMGIAGFSFEPESEAYAMDNGLVVLKQKGDVVQVSSSNMRAF